MKPVQNPLMNLPKAMGLSTVPIAKLRRDGGAQPRVSLDQDVVDDYAAAMKAGAKFPPVIAFYDGMDYWLADGFHRAAAAESIKRQKLATDVRQGTRRDAILFSVGANAVHGLRRSNGDKRRAVTCLLSDAEWSKWSDREIAKRCEVSGEMVHGMRRSLPTVGSEGDPRSYTTKHGTTATMRTANIGHNGRPRRLIRHSAADPQDKDNGDDSLLIEDDSSVALAEPLTAAEQFSKAVQAIYQRFDVINKRGGIQACLTQWTKEDAQSYLRTLRDIRQRCDDQIPKIEKRLKCSR